MQSGEEVGWRGGKNIDGWGKSVAGERVPTGGGGGGADPTGCGDGETRAAFIRGSMDPSGGGKSPSGTRTPD